MCAALAACGTTPANDEPQRPDAKALALKTEVKAQRAELVLSARFREEARLEGIRVDTPKADIVRARGKAVFTLRNLVVEADTVQVTWLADPAHEHFLLYATKVASFRQVRDRPYSSRNLSAIAMADDKVSFFQQ